MTAKNDLSTLNCSLARALAQVGDAWSLLILRDLLLGLRRFSDVVASLGIAKNILAARLAHLEETGIVLREGTEARPTYRLTDKGEALVPALVALQQWGDVFASKNVPPVVLRDAKGRAIERVALRTKAGPARPRDVRFHPGPGADGRTRAALLAILSRDDVMS